MVINYLAGIVISVEILGLKFLHDTAVIKGWIKTGKAISGPACLTGLY